ncbi:MAG: zinc ribbon domain-containing protein [Gemmatimonadales bacterium]|nr:zinc ribbon domain-containing protein [Gemmatimonadales bacterium]
MRSPLAVGEIQSRMMPYRACRRALGLDTAEEYELLLLRLVAEESGLARTNPPEAAERCRVEVAAVLPDLAFLQQLGEVTVQLRPGILQATAQAARRTRRPVEDSAESIDPEAPAVERRPPDQDSGPVMEPAAAPSGATTVVEPVADSRGDPAADPAPHGTDTGEPPPPPSSPAPGPLMTDSDSADVPATPLACPRCDRTLPKNRPVRFCPDCGQNVLVRLCPACRSEMEPEWRHCVMCGHAATDTSRFA